MQSRSSSCLMKWKLCTGLKKLEGLGIKDLGRFRRAMLPTMLL
jgi:hypothetical protein